MEESTKTITKLNLGCGTDYREGYINIDIDPDVKTDWCGDALEMPNGIERFSYKTEQHETDSISVTATIREPCADWADTFDEIYACHSLEHFYDLLTIVKEMVRVSKDGAIWTIIVPYWSWSQNQGNPYHHIYFSEHTFDFFGQKYKRGHKEDWTLEVLDVKYGWNLPKHLMEDQVDELIEYKDKYINVVKDITFTIKVRK